MFWIACRVFLAMTLLTGCIYPFIVTEIAHLIMPWQSTGSLLTVKDQVRGSVLIGQSFKGKEYFWPRPSTFNYQPLHSGGSNLGPTSRKLQALVKKRAQQASLIYHHSSSAIPTDLLYSSGSGLDPHISLKSAYFQMDRIIRARSLDSQKQSTLRQLIEMTSEGRQVGFLGPQYINVLKLNQLLDQHFSPAQAS